MRRSIRLTLTALSLLGLAACATVEGAGQDISDAGDFVSDTAREVRRAF
ncbi:MAG: entericidin A/B family lipoprotein [Pseudomonadota bacterium]